MSDAGLSPQEIGFLRIRDNLELFAGTCLTIKDKGGQMLPFLFNNAQRYVHERLEQQLRETGKVRALILKGRQQGISTYIAARFYHKTTTRAGQTALITAHEQKATDNLFKMVRRYHDNNPLPVSTGNTNAKELIFDKLNGGYILATAGSKDVGRSQTAQLAHLSEFAFWQNAQSHMAGLGNTVADIDGTEVVMESTANGLGNAFHSQWQDAEAGLSDYIAIFVPWYWQPEYRSPVKPNFVMSDKDREYQIAYGLDLEQMQWRANKISTYGAGFEWLFDQEYPACIVGDQRVGTDRGLIPISEIATGDKTAFGVVSDGWSNGMRETVKVYTRNGFVVHCTPDHRILLGDGNFEQAQSLQGKRIVLAPPAMCESYYTQTWNPIPGVTTSITFDEKWGRLLGYFMGDGSLYESCLSIACTGSDADVVQDVKNLFDAIVGGHTSRIVGKNGGCIEVRAERAYLSECFDRLGLLKRSDRSGKRMRKVSVPECIWRSPKSVVREFLRGLFEADGCAYDNWSKIVYFAKDIEFLRDIQRLLLAFGIVGQIDSRKAKNGQGLEYQANTLTLWVEAAKLFHERIGFVSKRKSSTANGAVKRGGRKPRPMLFDDEVVRIEPAGVHEVFDISVPSSERFDASGVVVHNCSGLAFKTSTQNPLISPNLVMQAVNSQYRDDYAPLIIGCDPAGDGANDADRTAIVFRRGRMVFRVEYHSGLNTMQIAGKLAEYTRQYQPDGLFVDKGGLGAGVFDRLQELNIAVIGINSASAATDFERYENKRAEMWWTMLEWFEDQPCRMPNNAALIADITAPQPKVSSNGRKLLEKKDDMKKRGIRSPDGADALALTFAMPVATRGGLHTSSNSNEPATSAGY